MTKRHEQQDLPVTTGDVTEVARLELLEERAEVEMRREIAGRVRVRREVEHRTETVTVELRTERLVVEVVQGSGDVLIDGVPLAPGETREIITYREEAYVEKRPVVAEEVRLLKRSVVEQQTLQVELGREVLHFVQADGTEDTVLRENRTPGGEG